MINTLVQVTESNIKNLKDEKMLQVRLLRPETEEMKEKWRDHLATRLENGNTILPKVSHLNGTETIDSNTIININNKTTAEQREEFMENILNDLGNSDNQAYLLTNSSEPVVSYVNDLVIRNSLNNTITEEQLDPIGNLVLYSIANLTGVGTINEILSAFQDSMYVLNNNRIFISLSEQAIEASQQTQELISSTAQDSERRIAENMQLVQRSGLHTTGLLNERLFQVNQFLADQNIVVGEDIRQRSDQFFKQIEEQRANSQFWTLVKGGMFVTNVVGAYYGLSPVGGVVKLACKGVSSVVGQMFLPPVVTPGISEIVTTIPNFFT